MGTCGINRETRKIKQEGELTTRIPDLDWPMDCFSGEGGGVYSQNIVLLIAGRCGWARVQGK